MRDALLQQAAEHTQMLAGKLKNNNAHGAGRPNRVTAFNAHFDGVHYGTITLIYVMVLVLQYYLGYDGYENLAQVLIGDEHITEKELKNTVIAIALLTAAVTTYCGHLLSSFDIKVREWYLSKAIKAGSSEIISRGRALNTLRTSRITGIVLTAVFLSLMGYGLLVRTETIRTANQVDEISIEGGIIDQVEKTMDDYFPDFLNSEKPASKELSEKLSHWATGIFLFALLVEFAAGIYVFLFIGHVINILLQYFRRKNSDNWFKQIVSSDAYVLSLVRESMGSDASLEVIRRKYHGAVLACCTRALNGNSESSSTYLNTSNDEETNEFAENGQKTSKHEKSIKNA